MASVGIVNKKNGISYRFFVSFIDENTQKSIRKSKTWTPPEDMTDEQASKQAVILAEEFEKKLKEEANYGTELKDYTIEQFSKIYLDYARRNTSISNYDRLEEIFTNHLIPMIGNLKIKKITPYVIQNYFNEVDDCKKTVIKIYPKKGFEDTLHKYNFNYTNLRRQYKIQHSTLTNALNGKAVSQEWADRLVEVTEIPFDKLFEVVKTIEEYSYYTLKKWKTALRQLLAYAKKQRVIDDNFATNDFVDYTQVGIKKDVVAMNDKEAQIYYNEVVKCEDIRIKTALLIFLLTGFRRGEVAGLQWSDIDFEMNTIRISRAVLHINGRGTIVKDPKTKKSARCITMPQILKEQLMAYKNWEFTQALIEEGKNPDGWVFTRTTGEVIAPDTFDLWHKKILKLAGLPHYKLHSLRHTNITLQIAAGVPLITVSGRAGHSRTSTTTDIYSHFLGTSDSAAANTLNDLFTKPKQNKPKKKADTQKPTKSINLISSIKDLKQYGINNIEDLKQLKEFGLNTLEEIKEFLSMQ